MDLGLEGKTCVVLASTSGLGLSAARALLAEGARVALSGRDQERLQAALDDLSSDHGERVFGDSLDVTDAEALARHIEKVRRRFGPVDVLVTNAGGPPAGPATDVTPETLERAYHLTLESAVNAIRLVLDEMRARRSGRIIAMTSYSVRQPIAGLALSNTMRAGLTGYLKTLSQEVGMDAVTVNSICTGMFATSRLTELFEIRAEKSGRTPAEERAEAEQSIPARRIGEPEEFGGLVAFLASKQASFVNGVALTFDGGAYPGLL